VILPPARDRRRLLACLFFFQAHAIALWFVPFSSVLKTHGLEHLTAWAFATGAVAAFVSPMLTGALADRHLSATVILRGLALGMAAFLFLTFWAIEHRWNSLVILGLVQVLQFCFAPGWGVTTMLVLAQLPDPGRQFGSLRVWGTFGWMGAGLLVSLVLKADGSTACGFVSAAAWLGVAALTFALPEVPPRAERSAWTWKGLFGFETFAILRNPQHRALFLSAGLFSVPLAAFYPYTPMHLQDLGVQKVSAAMALGQVFEAVSMYAMAPILSRFRLRSLFVFAIAVAFLRYILFASDTMAGVLVGILLHGICFTLFFIPAQIYIEHHIPRELRFRSQALMTLLISGFGNLFGCLGCGALRNACTLGGHTNWPLYWMVLAGAVALVGTYFLFAYRPLGAGAGELVGAQADS
jgi:MFS family permease